MTVLFDPGRIKRGVLPRDEVGSALVEGGSYTLVVDKDWRDANGNPMQIPYAKSFRVVSEARNGIDLKAWRVQPPNAHTIEPLVIDFPAPLDFALLHRLIEVHASHTRLEGTISVVQQEKQWRFTPVSPWSAGSYAIHVDTALEDVAGNRVGRPFDVDTFEPITAKVVRKTESIAFRCSFEVARSWPTLWSRCAGRSFRFSGRPSGRGPASGRFLRLPAETRPPATAALPFG